MTEQPFVRPGSWQHCGVVVPLVNLSLGRRIRATVNGSGDDVSLGSVSGSCASMILGRVTGPGIVGD